MNIVARLVGQLTAGHGVDSVDHREVNGAGRHQVGGNSRNTKAWVLRFGYRLRRAPGRYARAGVHRRAVSHGNNAWFIFGRLLAMDGAWRDAETVLHREGNAGSAVLFQLGQ